MVQNLLLLHESIFRKKKSRKRLIVSLGRATILCYLYGLNVTAPRSSLIGVVLRLMWSRGSVRSPRSKLIRLHEIPDRRWFYVKAYRDMLFVFLIGDSCDNSNK